MQFGGGAAPVTFSILIGVIAGADSHFRQVEAMKRSGRGCHKNAGPHCIAHPAGHRRVDD
jgi:hypothetical protein